MLETASRIHSANGGVRASQARDGEAAAFTDAACISGAMLSRIVQIRTDVSHLVTVQVQLGKRLACALAAVLYKTLGQSLSNLLARLLSFLGRITWPFLVIIFSYLTYGPFYFQPASAKPSEPPKLNHRVQSYRLLHA